ncbi:MAG: glucose-1-phosphate cytidylyltransferase [Candidatus Methanoperedens sp.]|nr:glucose-1-phosphate cytidylyltransferase [Candidatus Methanoperedens sp.]
MKVVILAGGYGTRLAEETDIKPKPMVEIGGKPILWHIMMHYAHYGCKDFYIALGYKGEVIKKYMVDFNSLNSNLTINLKSGTVDIEDGHKLDWIVKLVDTGMKTEIGGRIKRLAPYIGNETFMLTYGDGVSDVNLHDLLAFHHSHGKLATLTAVQPPERFGLIEIEGDEIKEFNEKPQTDENWINGGFFVFEPEIFDYIEGDETLWQKALGELTKDGQLMGYRHSSFWHCMDTLPDKYYLEKLWQSGNPPWKIWE